MSEDPNLLKAAAPTNVIRPVTPTFLEPRKDPEQEAEEELERKREARAASPFPVIPDVTIETELVEEDVTKFQENRKIDSSLRPSSPFPSIVDVTLTPEVVEKDVVKLRTSPDSFTIQPADVVENNLDNEIPKGEVLPTKKEMVQEDQEEVPFPSIPDISKYLDNKREVNMFKPIPTKPYAPVSISDKKYILKDPLAEYNPPPAKPEFNFALADTEHKVVENTFSTSTATNVRSLQSEIFESQGHFNASRSCSPFRVFVPKAEESPPKEAPKDEKPLTKVIIEKVEVEPKDPKCEEQMKKLAISVDKDKSEVILSQKGCFSELEEIKTAYDVAEKQISQYSKLIHDNQTDTEKAPEEKSCEDDESKDSQRDVEKGEVIASVDVSSRSTEEKKAAVDKAPIENPNQPTDRTPPKKGSVPDINMDVDEYLKKKTEKEKKKVEIKPKEKSPPKEEMEIEEPRRYKKPPEAIIGARPLFGQLDINSEFKKALVGKQKSIQGKRSREVNRNVDRRDGPEPRIKIEKTEYDSQEEYIENGKLATESKTTETAQVEVIRPNENEEIEKIYYQQEREFNIDFQVVQAEGANGNTNLYIEPESLTKVNNDLQNFQRKCVQNQSWPLLRPDPRIANYALEDGDTTFSGQIQYMAMEEQEEQYRKIPVKSLIQNFEQSVRPPLRYKQIRDPLPDVVEKLSSKNKPPVKQPTHESTQSQQFQSVEECRQVALQESTTVPAQNNNVNQEQFLKSAEEEFDNLFYVTNSKVENHHYSPDTSKMQVIQQSEDSSFCAYTSQSSQLKIHSASAFQPVQRSNGQFNSGQQQEGKLVLVSPHVLRLCIVNCILVGMLVVLGVFPNCVWLIPLEIH